MRHACTIASLAGALTLAACSAPRPTTSAPTLAQLQAPLVKNLAMPQPGLVTAGQPTEVALEPKVVAKLKK